MLPETGALELIFLAAVALIVVGPKDLPVLMRKVGQATAKLRGLAAEFRASFDELARQSELDELRREVEALRQGQLASLQPIQHDLESHFVDLKGAINGTPSPPPPPVVPDTEDAASPHALPDLAKAPALVEAAPETREAKA